MKSKLRSKCEYVQMWKPTIQFCDEPTTHYYPVGGGRTMALCLEHAEPHLAYATPVAINPGIQKDNEYSA